MIKENFPKLRQLFTTIAAIDSPSGEEAAMSDFVVKYLENLGFAPYKDKNNMVYCSTGSDPKALFCAHMDTVEPGRGIKVIEKDGFLVSEGKTILGGDDKIAIAAILIALSELVTTGKKPNIELLFTVREETDSGVQHTEMDRINAKTGFIFDGGHGEMGWVVTQASTIYDFIFELTGIPTHASTPESGKNVLDVFTRIGNKLNIGRYSPTTTFNIGLINGGDATNTIPGKLTLKGDLRSTSPEDFKSAQTQITQVFEELGAQYEVKVDLHWLPYAFGYSLSKDSESYRKLETIYQKNGLELAPVSTTSGSDAGFLNSKGIVTFCLGDGVIDSHTVDERISVENFILLENVVENLMTEWN